MKKYICSIVVIAIATACFCSSSTFAAEAKKKPTAAPAETTKKAVTTTPSNKLMSAGEYTISWVTDHPKNLALTSEKHGKWIITPAEGIMTILKQTGIKKCNAIVSIDTAGTPVIAFHTPASKSALASYPEAHPVKIKATGTTADAATTTSAKSKPKSGV